MTDTKTLYHDIASTLPDVNAGRNLRTRRWNT